MKSKMALLLLIVLFASTIATIAVTFSLPAPAALSTRQIVQYKAGFGIQPTGDPIDDPIGPTAK